MKKLFIVLILSIPMVLTAQVNINEEIPNIGRNWSGRTSSILNRAINLINYINLNGAGVATNIELDSITIEMKDGSLQALGWYNGDTIYFRIPVSYRSTTSFDTRTTTAARDTLTTADWDCIVYMNTTTTNDTMCIPLNASQAFLEGQAVNIVPLNSGTSTLLPLSGVTLYEPAADAALTSVDFTGPVTLIRQSDANTWLVFGGI